MDLDIDEGYVSEGENMMFRFSFLDMPVSRDPDEGFEESNDVEPSQMYNVVIFSYPNFRHNRLMNNINNNINRNVNGLAHSINNNAGNNNSNNINNHNINNNNNNRDGDSHDNPNGNNNINNPVADREEPEL